MFHLNTALFLRDLRLLPQELCSSGLLRSM